jgi:hypothetical protein
MPANATLRPSTFLKLTCIKQLGCGTVVYYNAVEAIRRIAKGSATERGAVRFRICTGLEAFKDTIQQTETLETFNSVSNSNLHSTQLACEQIVKHSTGRL